MQESAARILFIMIEWIKNYSVFKYSNKNEQLNKFNKCWKALYLLFLCEWRIPINLYNTDDFNEKNEFERNLILMKNLICQFDKFQLNTFEFQMIKVKLILGNTDLNNCTKLDSAFKLLNEYSDKIKESTIEIFFFKNTLGSCKLSFILHELVCKN